MEQFYTYLWLRQDGTPYYVGKGKGYRAFTNCNRKVVKKPTEKLLIILEYHESESQAFEAERFLISFYGRFDIGTGCLRNMTDGGDGASPSLETRKKIGLASKGNNYAKGNSNRKGAVVSESTRKKMSLSKIGRSSPNKGKKMSEEQKSKISSSKKGKSPAWNKGIPWSPEVIEKIAKIAKTRCDSEKFRKFASIQGTKGARARWGKTEKTV